MLVGLNMKNKVLVLIQLVIQIVYCTCDAIILTGGEDITFTLF